MVVQEQRQIIFAVDSAHSKVVCNMKTKEKKISRYLNDDVDKIHFIGKDIAFVSGANYVIDPVIEKLNDFLDSKKRIYTEELKKYLLENYPYSKCPIKEYGLSDIGITILRVMNNEAIMIKMDQCNDFEPVISKAKQGEIKLSVDGFDNQRIYENGSKFLNRLSNFGWRSPEALITIYQNNYSEGVGGLIKVYKLDWSGCNLIKSQKLEEKNLNYISIDEDGNEIESNDKLEFKSCLQACTGTFTGTVQAGQVIGGTVEGTTINGSTINGTVINGSTIYGGEIIGGTITSEAGGIDYGTVTIDDGAVISSFDNGGDHIELTMGGVSFDVGIHLADGRTAYSNLQHSGVRTGLTGGSYAEYLRSGINIGTSSSYNFTADNSGNVSCKTLSINGASPLTTSNYSSYAAPISHMQSSYTITPTLTAAQNISLYGEPNAASTWWVNANFEKLSASDFRLKKNIFDINIPNDVYFDLKPKQYEFKCDENRNGVCFGLVAQQTQNVFSKYGLNPTDYNLFRFSDPKSYTDEGLYVGKDKINSINYENMTSWTVKIVQDLNKKISDLESRINVLEDKLSENSTNL
jgi:hypothetical protein